MPCSACNPLIEIRYKVRPKLHQLHCEIILRVHAGGRLNPKIPSCFNDESFIGLICGAARKAPHAATMCKTLLQRWLLDVNARLVH